MANDKSVNTKVQGCILSLLDDKNIAIFNDTPLIGDGSLLDSMKLVELCLMLEDTAADLGFEFNWTSDATLSRSRSMFRTVGTIIEEFTRQMDEKK
jgi:acyl carrier protein